MDCLKSYYIVLFFLKLFESIGLQGFITRSNCSTWLFSTEYSPKYDNMSDTALVESFSATNIKVCSFEGWDGASGPTAFRLIFHPNRNFGKSKSENIRKRKRLGISKKILTSAKRLMFFTTIPKTWDSAKVRQMNFPPSFKTLFTW